MVAWIWKVMNGRSGESGGIDRSAEFNSSSPRRTLPWAASLTCVSEPRSAIGLVNRLAAAKPPVSKPVELNIGIESIGGLFGLIREAVALVEKEGMRLEIHLTASSMRALAFASASTSDPNPATTTHKKPARLARNGFGINGGSEL